MKLNCDLGESFGAWTMGLDQAVIPHIDMANIACGFHAGDPDVIANTLSMTQQCGTQIGAHPSYPDQKGFGRRHMQILPDELINLLHYQIAALDGMARIHGQQLSYVKPHGALYNLMMADNSCRKTVMQAVSSYHSKLKLMILATAQADQHLKEAEQFGIGLLFEAFADRRYDINGHLLDRQKPGAVLNKAQILDQVNQLVKHNKVTTDCGRHITIMADTLCVHGDNSESIEMVKQIKAICQTQTPK
ncbi:5-oxoprolinase subunit PxpA [Alteromonas sediminis]|uniref:5-oxoprolinase subunit PxpA n=1 Tax=Alteromonas sediminis TaxID=2259342 RepID=A0A3N5Y821_9ALTE|nr:5-oxoprolinase subunit PxpA [Alteromonas sediminis]RPJ67059.1 5-oxoprolinase subunit PxpA [Alteromonas sediminis]